MDIQSDLLQLLQSAKYEDAQRHILRNNVNVNNWDQSLLGITLSRSENKMTLFLLACGAIPTVEDYSSCADASLQRAVAFFAKAMVEGWSRYSAETIMSRIVSRSKEKDPTQCVDSAIQQVKVLWSSAAMKYGQKQPPEDVIRSWISRATPEGFFLRPLSVNISISGIKLIQACHNDDEPAIIQQLLAAKHEDVQRLRHAPGGWSLVEEAMIKGWSHVERHLRSCNACPVGVDLTNMAIENRGLCDGEIVCSDDTRPLFFHRWILNARCPLILSDTQSQQTSCSCDENVFLALCEYCSNASDVIEAPKLSRAPNKVYQLPMSRIIVKGILEYCYLDFVTHDTFQRIQDEKLLGTMSETALKYDLGAIARACILRRKQLPFPHFFKHPRDQHLILALHKRNEDGGRLTKEPKFFPTVAESLRSSLDLTSLHEYPTAEIIRRFMESGANKILIAENNAILVHDALLRARCRFFESMFDSGMKESTSTSIRMNDVSFLSVRNLVHFLYTDHLELPITIDVALELASLGTMFLLPQLVTMVKNRIASDVTIEEYFILRLVRYARDSQDEDLLKRCTDWFVSDPQALTRLAQQERQQFFDNIDDELFSTILEHLPQEVRSITARNVTLFRSVGHQL